MKPQVKFHANLSQIKEGAGPSETSSWSLVAVSESLFEDDMQLKSSS